MARDVEEQVGENHCTRLAMEKHNLVEGWKCPHESLIHFVGPCGRRIVAEGCGEIQIRAFGIEPGRTEGFALGYALGQSGTNR